MRTVLVFIRVGIQERSAEMFTFHPFDLISFSILALILVAALGFLGFMVYVGLTVIKRKQ